MDDSSLARLEQLGFEPSSVAEHGGTIIVDDDIVLDRNALLAGEYAASPVEPVDPIEKGYRYKSGIVSKANAGKIRLAWAAGARAPNAAIKAAFTHAASAWSAIPDSNLRIGTDLTGPTITVHMINSDLWPPANLVDCRESSACAEFPRKGKPGANIYLENHPLTLKCLSWKTALLEGVARHELGHAIGFAHPKEAGSLHVDGTKACTGSAAACLHNPGPKYTTIMSMLEAGNCSSISPRLTQDDYATAAALY